MEEGGVFDEDDGELDCPGRGLYNQNGTCR